MIYEIWQQHIKLDEKPEAFHSKYAHKHYTKMMLPRLHMRDLEISVSYMHTQGLVRVVKERGHIKSNDKTKSKYKIKRLEQGFGPLYKVMEYEDRLCFGLFLREVQSHMEKLLNNNKTATQAH